MEDREIVELFEERNEKAIREIERKYYRLCYGIARNLLNDPEDCKECVNDTWFSVWNCIPPKKPAVLAAFVSRIVRGHAVDRIRKKYAGKRVDSHLADIQGELEGIDAAAGSIPEEIVEQKEMTEFLNRFLRAQQIEVRKIFLMRYWYCDSIQEIADCMGISKGNVRTILYRTRKKLKAALKGAFYE